VANKQRKIKTARKIEQMKTVKNIDFNLIIPKGTQIVLLNETKVLNENRFHAKGTVGKIVELPVDAAGARRTVAVYFSRSADRNKFDADRRSRSEYAEAE
jgi:hypothetical protein